MRKLVTIKPITAIDSIPEADNICKVTVDGAWTLVSQISNNFKVGDNVVYCEIDSMLPTDNPAFAFLANRGVHSVDGISYHRLRTIKLKKQISQGLIVPIENIFEIVEIDGEKYININDSKLLDYGSINESIQTKELDQ